MAADRGPGRADGISRFLHHDYDAWIRFQRPDADRSDPAVRAEFESYQRKMFNQETAAQLSAQRAQQWHREQDARRDLARALQLPTGSAAVDVMIEALERSVAAQRTGTTDGSTPGAGHRVPASDPSFVLPATEGMGELTNVLAERFSQPELEALAARYVAGVREPELTGVQTGARFIVNSQGVATQPSGTEPRLVYARPSVAAALHGAQDRLAASDVRTAIALAAADATLWNAQLDRATTASASSSACSRPVRG